MKIFVVQAFTSESKIMINQTMTRLRGLRLNGMADGLNLQQEQPGTYEGLSFEERFALLVDQEDADRTNKRLARFSSKNVTRCNL